MNSLYIKNKKKKLNPALQKLFISASLLLLLKIGNTIPLSSIAQEDLQKSFLFSSKDNSLIQILNMYTSGGNSKLSIFTLGIIPYINASIIIDLFTGIIPFLEKLQSEEGEFGRKKIFLYKKILCVILSIIQSYFLITYLKPYFYKTDFFTLLLTGIELVAGSMIIIWITNLIDTKGIGNGSSLIIFVNILTNFFTKISITSLKFDFELLIEIIFLLFLVLLICISQTATIDIEIISARQLVYLQTIKKRSSFQEYNSNFKENGLSIKLNQAGIFPIIIASNLLAFFPFLLRKENNILYLAIYYSLIILFNYFYTSIFWDPIKISEQLRKASVSIINVTPGKQTILYLENMVKTTSLIGGIFLCLILSFYNFSKIILKGTLLNQLNITSLIIVIGIAYDLHKIIRSLIKVNVKENQ
jgi:preprotein translocase subunit SecY